MRKKEKEDLSEMLDYAMELLAEHKRYKKVLAILHEKGFRHPSGDVLSYDFLKIRLAYHKSKRNVQKMRAQMDAKIEAMKEA